jgi:hypothetical protein
MKPIKKLITFVIFSWQSTMDSRYSSLHYIKDPSLQVYFTMALFIMWSAYFGIVAWVWLEWQNYSIIWSIWIHLSVVVPISVTNIVFREAENNGAKWLHNWKK